jgi:hypothetical protein
MPKHVGVELERITNNKNSLRHTAFVGLLTYEISQVIYNISLHYDIQF